MQAKLTLVIAALMVISTPAVADGHEEGYYVQAETHPVEPPSRQENDPGCAGEDGSEPRSLQESIEHNRHEIWDGQSTRWNLPYTAPDCISVNTDLDPIEINTINPCTGFRFMVYGGLKCSRATYATPGALPGGGFPLPPLQATPPPPLVVNASYSIATGHYNVETGETPETNNSGNTGMGIRFDCEECDPIGIG